MIRAVSVQGDFAHLGIPVPKLIMACRDSSISIVTFAVFAAHLRVVPEENPGIPVWTKDFFCWLCMPLCCMYVKHALLPPEHPSVSVGNEVIA